MTPPQYPAGSRRQASLRQERARAVGAASESYRPTQRRDDEQARKASTRKRLVVVAALCGVIVLALVGRLAWVQVVWGPDLAAQAQQQRARVYVEPARRGAITDRDGEELTYTMQARSLTVSPNRLRDELREQAELQLQAEGLDIGLSADELAARLDEAVAKQLQEMADGIPGMLPGTEEVRSEEILDKLTADSSYEVLVRNVDPDVATEIAAKYWGVAADHQDIREYPNGAIGENIIGKVSMDGQGQFGFEASGNAMLSGVNGRTVEDVSTDGQVIPGTLRDVIPPEDGDAVTLTIDLELQTFVQQKLEQAKANSLAKSAEAVVLDARTGEILAMANTDTIDPNGDLEKQLADGKDFENPSVSAPFEPGSVAKIITAAGVIEEGLSTPDEVLQVPGSIDMAGVNVRDAWDHGVVGYTTTGVFGKSSNVGTLMLAQRLGEDTYAEYLEKFGIGQTTGVELPNESAGLLPNRDQWSGGTFANLPIGQGMSWTTLQMASVYQTLANGGERIEPRIIRQVTEPDGTVVPQPEPETTRVVSPETARTVVDMFRAVTQSDPTGVQQGTGASAAVAGYQISGKTGTAQQVDPNTGAYSNSNYWITFAGIAPADDPNFVVAIMLDNPQRGVEDGGSGGESAAPLFHDIAAWLLDQENTPLSPPQEGQLILQAQ